MIDAHRAALALEPPADVHQAAEIAAREHGRAARGDVRGLVGHDLRRDLRILHAERAAEAAAHFGILHFGQRDAFDAREQRARLRLDAEAAQARAGVVIGERALGHRGALGPRPAEHVDEKARQLVRARGKPLGARPPGGIVREQIRVVVAQRADARAGRRDDIVVALERFDRAARDAARVVEIAAVQRGLAAAGLRARRVDGATGRLEQLHGRERGARPEQIREARDEQADARRLAGAAGRAGGLRG
ncbi:hypothetical protein DP49_5025 [Burkholderia pseudomallei]|nr:hypothetical protein DP49_5025 [Burkholderia pseudomallei]